MVFNPCPKPYTRIKDPKVYKLYSAQHTYCEIPDCENKRIFVSTHHIVFRSRGGSDIPDNFMALCQYHHEMAHFRRQPNLLDFQLMIIKEQITDKYNEYLRDRLSNKITIEVGNVNDKIAEFVAKRKELTELIRQEWQIIEAIKQEGGK